MRDFDGITTRRGDGGESGLFDGTRRRKSDLLFEALGDLDELASFVGVAKAALRARGAGGDSDAAEAGGLLERVQNDLLRIGAQAATPAADRPSSRRAAIGQADVETLENAERLFLDRSGAPRGFVLPGGTVESAHLDVARSVCRRAERRVVSCVDERRMQRLLPCVAYLNRLSDLLFLMARAFD